MRFIQRLKNAGFPARGECKPEAAVEVVKPVSFKEDWEVVEEPKTVIAMGRGEVNLAVAASKR